MSRRWAMRPSPIGPLLVTAVDDHVTGLYMGCDPPPGSPADDEVLGLAAAELDAYFAGELTAFTVPVELGGTPFQRRVWSALLAIPFGTVTSYGALARELGNPNGMRAVGLANGRNPVSIIVPCHRVIGADGSLTGYGGGIERKRWLLAHEQVAAASRDGRLL